MPTETPCRQNALCHRKHDYCDGCGRYVHGVTCHDSGYAEYEDPIYLCFLCDNDTKWRREQERRSEHAESPDRRT
jgi:hypothetical protein